jgi:uncharacterized membrane protein YcaP (DUF421 family)
MLMKMLTDLFGQGKDLSIIQMCMRVIVVFIIALLLIRISGRRSFGMRTPLDSIITIILGAVLSRAIVGASPFMPVIISCASLVLFHRFCGWMIVRNKMIRSLAEGNRILLFEKGSFIKHNLDKALVCEEDIMRGVRKSALTDDLQAIDKIYMETSGEISALKK